MLTVFENTVLLRVLKISSNKKRKKNGAINYAVINLNNYDYIYLFQLS